MRGVPANATLITDDLRTILWKVYESNIVQRLVYSSRCQGHVERSPRNVILFFFFHAGGAEEGGGDGGLAWLPTSTPFKDVGQDLGRPDRPV